MLYNQRVRLRSLQQDDLSSTIKWRNDPEIKTSSMMHPFPLTEELEKEWYSLLKDRSNNSLWFGIELKGKESLIGFTFLSNINWINKNCNLGIVIGPKQYRGKGIGNEVMEILIYYAFNTLNLNKITLTVHDGNQAAIRLYRKLGFRQEGRLKDQFFTGGKYRDVLIFSIFNSQYRDE